MWLRIVRAQGLIGSEIVALALRFEEEDLPGIMQLPGFLATGLGVNPARGGALVLVFWENERHMLDAAPLEDQARDRLARDFGNKDPYRNDGLEVIFATDVIASEGSVVTPYMHLARFDGLTDETFERMTETCIQDARLDVRERGSEGVVIGADREAGILAAISFWESMRDMRAVRREYTGAVPGVELPYTDNFEVVIARSLEQLDSTETQSSSLAD